MKSLLFRCSLFLFSLLAITFTNVLSQTCSNETKCTTKACCSKWGNCGYGPDFCENDCQNDCDAKPECGQYAENGKKECPLKVCCSQFGFCGTTADFCKSDGCQSGCTTPAQKSCDSGRPLLNIGYYASWSSARKCHAFTVDNIDPRNYTHLNYAFGSISGGLMVDPSGDEAEKMAAFVHLKAINPDLKVLISVGGWAFNDPGPTRKEFHNIISSEGSRSAFISSVSSYLRRFGFDGIDIDYHAKDRGGYPKDTENYLKLVEEMRASLGKKVLITIAAPASYWYLRHFPIGRDHGVWDKGIKSLGPYVKSHTNITEIKEGIALFLRDGVPPEKLVLGLGLYGRAFTLKNPACTAIGCEFSGPSKAGECTEAEGTLAWFEIADIAAKKNVSPKYDEQSMSEIMVWGDQWVAFDDDKTLSMKREYASSSCFKGVMFWSIDQGLDRASGRYDLMQVGSVAHSIVQLWFDEAYNRFSIDFTRDARDGYIYVTPITYGQIDPGASSNSSLMSGSKRNHTTRRRRQSGPGKPGQNCLTSRNFVSIAVFFASLLQRMIYNSVTGIDPDLTMIRPNDRANPVEYSFLRDIPSGAQRVEFLVARFAPRHLSPNNRVNFPNSGKTSSWYMRNKLNGRPNDERGHLVGSYASGPRFYYNMVPQDKSVNRNFYSRWVLNDWNSVERRIIRHLNVIGGEVTWRVAMHYDDATTGRPSSFTYEAVFFDQNGNQVHNIFGTMRNCPPRDGIDPDGRCLGL
ncbi:hypothetical protein TYRP_015957 [Tyrophagus putrescentiae]|nr:hypothetical protein TYRP_015957 [Tyrophagus putrescentiae]